MRYHGRIRASSVDWLSLSPLAVGAINWGLVGIGTRVGTNLDLLSLLLGGTPELEALVNVLAGLASVYEPSFVDQLYSAGTAPAATREGPA